MPTRADRRFGPWGAKLTLLATAIVVVLLIAACGGDDGESGDDEEPVEAEPVTISFDRETSLDEAALTAEQQGQLADRQGAVVAGISGTIAQSPANVGTSPGDVKVSSEPVVSDGGEVIRVGYTVSGVTIATAFGGTKEDDQVVAALYPLLGDGQLATVGDAEAVVEHGIVFPPNFIPDESDPLESLIDYNEAIGGGEAGTQRPEGEPVRAFEIANGPTLFWP
ncbi:MAG: hypothetical protein ACR2N6_04070 [Miltoncostaeaceae bacterium]